MAVDEIHERLDCCGVRRRRDDWIVHARRNIGELTGVGERPFDRAGVAEGRVADGVAVRRALADRGEQRQLGFPVFLPVQLPVEVEREAVGDLVVRRRQRDVDRIAGRVVREVRERDR